MKSNNHEDFPIAFDYALLDHLSDMDWDKYGNIWSELVPPFRCAIGLPGQTTIRNHMLDKWEDWRSIANDLG